jgi:SAM-dependent methyltransferase
MLKEISHFARHLPRVAAMRCRMSHRKLVEVLMDSCEGAGLAERRRTLVADLTGNILEIGCGTGRMFTCYCGDVDLTAIEPVARRLQLAEQRARQCDVEVSFAMAKGEDLPFHDKSSDAVVFANVLCSVDSVEKTLAEAHRVLRPGGQIRLLEHVQSHRFISASLMHLFNPVWRLLDAQGCNMNRRSLAAVRMAGFQVLDVERFQLFSPGIPAFPTCSIRAVRVAPANPFSGLPSPNASGLSHRASLPCENGGMRQ